MSPDPRLVSLAARHGLPTAAVVLLVIDLYATAEATVGVVIDPTQLQRLATLAGRRKLVPSGLLAMPLDLFLSQAEAREPDQRGFPLAGFVRLTMDA